MTLDDVDIIRRLDHEAFEVVRRRQMMRSLRPRTHENMSAAIDRPHPGVVIELPVERVVGYCFTHVWGSLGWLGTLGVSPRHQGLGLGRAVTAAGLDVLREAGCNTLALETMPESGKNLALYARLGLDVRQLTLLCQGTPSTAPSTQFEVWRAGDTLAEVANALVPGLDPTPAARWLAAEDGGDTLLWHENGHPAAFAVLRTTPRRHESMQAYLTVEALGCLPDAAAHWSRYLGEIQAYARGLGKMGLVLPVNARQSALLRGVLDAGFRIVHTRVRMVDGPPIGAPDALMALTLAM